MQIFVLLITLCLGFAQAADWTLSKNENRVQLMKRNLVYDFSQKGKLRAVNLGGWFVLEPFITPSLFDQWSKPNDDSQVPVDEYHYCKKLGKEVCKQRLESHWKTWITEDDFKQISDAGLNAVRIPIGYWAYLARDEDPYVQGQDEYLEKALSWAKKHNIKVLIDLHGAVGSQNGFDNSGLRDHYDFQKDNNTQLTFEALNKIISKYNVPKYYDVVLGIELLNEPLGPVLNMDGLKQYFTDGYNKIREGGSVQNVVIHDAFQQSGYWNDFLNLPAWNIVVDHHHYEVFSPEVLQKSIDQHIETVCEWGRNSTKEYHWNFVGEWSAALTDCTRWLNGVGKGARYSGDFENSKYIDSCGKYLDYSTWPSTYKTNVRKFVEAQLDAYELSAGWIFWTWKTEDAVEWSMQRLLAGGFFPQPLSDRQYPNQCGF